MLFSEIYGSRLDDKLGTADRTQRFTTAKRKQYANDGQRKFNELTGCYQKRLTVSLTDQSSGPFETDIEALATDFCWPAATTVSLKRVGTDTSYVEGPDLEVVTEETLNNIDPNWRAASPGTPQYVYWRNDGGARYLGLHPAPDVPAGETWTLLLPYVATPPDMSADSDEPFGASAPRITLRPYHDAVLFYAAAECELLRKDVEKHEYWMKRFAGEVARYTGTQAPKSGQAIRLAINYRRRRVARVYDPTRWP